MSSETLDAIIIICVMIILPCLGYIIYRVMKKD